MVNCDEVPACIDLRGWVFDDNNGFLNGSATTGVGIAAGACRFSNDPLWSCIPAGTIIVIYNDADPNPAMPVNDLNMNDNNCTLNIPISSTLFEKHTSLPSSSNSSYSTSGWVAGGSWTNISMANSQDGFQIYDPTNMTAPVFSVGWGSNNINGDIYMGSGTATDDVFYLTDCNYLNQTSWSQGCAGDPGCGTDDQTPGSVNLGQEDCVGAMNHNCNPPIISLTTIDETCSGNCDGSADVVISGGTPAFDLIWSPVPSNGQGLATASGLCAGSYSFSFTDDNGNGCVWDTIFTINSNISPDIFSINTITTCGQYVLTTINGSNLTGNESYYTGPNASGISYQPGDVISSSITLFAYDNNGSCSDEESFNIIINTGAIDLGNDTVICQGESVLLDAGIGFLNYLWQDGSTSQTFTATASGMYWCQVQQLGTNQIQNGDFELGDNFFSSTYTNGTGGAWGTLSNPGTYEVSNNPQLEHNNFMPCGDHTSGNGQMLVVNGASTAGANVA